MILELMKQLKEFSNTNIIITFKYYQDIKNVLEYLKDIKEKKIIITFLMWSARYFIYFCDHEIKYAIKQVLQIFSNEVEYDTYFKCVI